MWIWTADGDSNIKACSLAAGPGEVSPGRADKNPQEIPDSKGNSQARRKGKGVGKKARMGSKHVCRMWGYSARNEGLADTGGLWAGDEILSGLFRHDSIHAWFFSNNSSHLWSLLSTTTLLLSALALIGFKTWGEWVHSLPCFSSMCLREEKCFGTAERENKAQWLGKRARSPTDINMELLGSFEESHTKGNIRVKTSEDLPPP